MNDNKPETKTQALFDTKQAAKFLGVSVRTLKRWLKSGKLVPKIKGDKGRGKCDIFSEEQLKNVTPDEKTVSSTAEMVQPDEKTVSSTAEMVQPDEKTVSSTAEMVQPDARLVTGSESFALIPISTDGRKALVRVVNNLKESGNSIEYIDDESKNIAQGAVFIQPSSCIEYIDAESKNIAQSAVFIQPETFYSPKDKVSYAIWNKEIKIELNYNRPVITITNSEIFGCLINLDYRQIFESEDVVTGAEFSDFDRSVYDAIVTLCVAGNMVFSTEQIWRIICKNPSAKLTDAERIKIAKSIFHIGNFLLTILTDHKEKPEAWEEK
ncbi:MAG: helix-turn-helix domain-containing protein, partial [Selenomonadaceae bacterium]|nr:helix-turn-helix domain-containing protein [Selenomonadaceae bacterium]